MSFNALSNVARKKTKWKKIQKSTIFTKVDGKVVIRSSILTAPPPPTLFQCWNITDHMRIEEYR